VNWGCFDNNCSQVRAGELSMTNPQSFKVAIVGAGPSGFYAAEELLNYGVQVDMYEKLPVPFGLVRYGVAPDHQKLKLVSKVFERTAQRDGFQFIGNTEIGANLPLSALQEHYDAVVLCHGASQGRKPGIPGDNLSGCYTAADFIGWYNGHPDFQHLAPDLSCRSVAIIGHGNVSIDVARILAKTPAELSTSDITDRALQALSHSRIEEIHLIGRRGPAQAKFTTQELRELGELYDADVVIDRGALEIDEVSRAELDDRKNLIAIKNFEIFTNFNNKTSRSCGRKIIFHFLESPVRVLGETIVEGLELGVNRLEGQPFHQTARAIGERRVLACEAVLFSIGYLGQGLYGIDFDGNSSTYPHNEGKVTTASNVYAAGWIKRGPTGIIGTNKPCAQETVATLLRDLEYAQKVPKAGHAAIIRMITQRATSYADWRCIDKQEIEEGERRGKPREKFTSVAEYLALLSENEVGGE
jgi:ferredoxin--NADP+ reductase|tara:strand:- start:699 stop:2111 length:1413 start_codon:yes stop_codon:yes gene_type:complete